MAKGKSRPLAYVNGDPPGGTSSTSFFPVSAMKTSPGTGGPATEMVVLGPNVPVATFSVSGVKV